MRIMIGSILIILSLMNSLDCRPVENVALIKGENGYESKESLLFASLTMKEDEIGTAKIGLDLIRKRRNSPCTDQFQNVDRLTYNQDPQMMLQNLPEEFNSITIFTPCQNDYDFSRWGG